MTELDIPVHIEPKDYMKMTQQESDRENQWEELLYKWLTTGIHKKFLKDEKIDDSQ